MFSYNTYNNYEYTPANEKIILAAVKRERRTSRDIAQIWDHSYRVPSKYLVTNNSIHTTVRGVTICFHTVTSSTCAILRRDTSKNKRLALSQTFCAKIIHARNTKTRQTHKRNTEAPSYNHCCSGKAKVLHILSVNL
jgi:hypothetical protein